MRQRGILWVALVCVTVALSGCGGGSGVGQGVPAETKGEPVNPTPDMGPATKTAK